MKCMTKAKPKSSVKSNAGLITLDFLFGFLLSFAFLMIFFALAYSLTIVEVVQYIAFAGSRTFMAADINISAQKSNANAKVASLTTDANKFAKNLNKNWFVVGKLTTLESDKSAAEFNIGVQIPLTIKLLDFKVPFFGQTKVTNSGQGFDTQLSSYLIREPTEKECNDFNDARPLNMQTKAAYDPRLFKNYYRISDNG